jgi:thiamine-monophosphate kinase
MMKLSDLGEFGLISQIEKAFGKKSPGAPLGIGDDAAALFVSPGKTLLATTDMLLEGVHFDLSYTDFYSLGWKSAAVNLSDIAAMGGIPRFSLTALGIPEGISVEQVNEFYKGFKALIRKYKVDLVGGDTCSSEVDLVVSVTVLGEVEEKKMLTRAGAKPGDRIFVTGTLGDSAAGLELLLAKGKGLRAKGKDVNSAFRIPHSALIKRHLRPVPRIEIGRKLALSGCATSMIDVSDGLSSDLAHICEQSGVGADIYAEKIPLSKEIKAAAKQLKTIPLHYALSGGEDYELLFTVTPSKLKKFRSLRIPSREIGVITRGEIDIIHEGGERRRLEPTGYNHFRK